MTNKVLNGVAFCAAMMLPMSNSAIAGGLSDAIVEDDPDVVAQAAPAALPAWVLPAVGLLILGAIASSSGGGGSSGDATPTGGGGATPTPTPTPAPTPPGLGDIK